MPSAGYKRRRVVQAQGSSSQEAASASGSQGGSPSHTGTKTEPSRVLSSSGKRSSLPNDGTNAADSDSDGDGNGIGGVRDREPAQHTPHPQPASTGERAALRGTVTHQSKVQEGERTDVAYRNDRPFEGKPMLELQAGSNVWYQAYLVAESANEVKLEVPTGAPGSRRTRIEWVHKGSSRIWRGSLRAEAWRHLGKGAWEPRQTRKRARHARRAGLPRSGALRSGAGLRGWSTKALASPSNLACSHRRARPHTTPVVDTDMGLSTENSSGRRGDGPGGDTAESPHHPRGLLSAPPPAASGGKAQTSQQHQQHLQSRNCIAAAVAKPPAAGGREPVASSGGMNDHAASTHSPLPDEVSPAALDQNSTRALSSQDDAGFGAHPGIRHVLLPHRSRQGAMEPGHTSCAALDPLSRWFVRHMAVLAATGVLGCMQEGSLESGTLPSGFCYDPMARRVVRAGAALAGQAPGPSQSAGSTRPAGSSPAQQGATSPARKQAAIAATSEPLRPWTTATPALAAQREARHVASGADACPAGGGSSGKGPKAAGYKPSTSPRQGTPPAARPSATPGLNAATAGKPPPPHGGGQRATTGWKAGSAGPSSGQGKLPGSGVAAPAPRPKQAAPPPATAAMPPQPSHDQGRAGGGRELAAAAGSSGTGGPPQVRQVNAALKRPAALLPLSPPTGSSSGAGNVAAPGSAPRAQGTSPAADGDGRGGTEAQPGVGAETATATAAAGVAARCTGSPPSSDSGAATATRHLPAALPAVPSAAGDGQLLPPAGTHTLPAQGSGTGTAAPAKPGGEGTQTAASRQGGSSGGAGGGRRLSGPGGLRPVESAPPPTKAAAISHRRSVIMAEDSGDGDMAPPPPQQDAR